MNLYIQIKNEKPINHPASEENIITAFKEIPPDWEVFVRIEPPILGDYEKFDIPDVTYEKINGVWTDVYHIVSMTEEEKLAKNQIILQAQQIKKVEKINAYKVAWQRLPDRDNFSAWVFNEETCKYEPPIPRPTDREVFWQGITNSWVDLPVRPDNGKNYKFDYVSAIWVELTQ